MSIVISIMMCDTFVMVRTRRGQGGGTLFGKNSDRPADEVQLVTHIPACRHPVPSELRCTHISIPQAEETYAVLLSQPYWMWGVEMGTNEHGVAIGNEAVWTTEPVRDTGLTGMDLVRLGLERAASARKALEVITELLERHGQGGGCTLSGDMRYHNSFLLADRREAWVLETADRWWAAERIIEGPRNISNRLSISGPGDMRSDGLLEHAVKRELCGSMENFSFASVFSQGGWDPKPSPYSREGRCRSLLRKHSADLSPVNAADILRDHDAGICMHGGFLSTGSQVSLLSEAGDAHWFTGTAPPCLSAYHPYVFQGENQGTAPPGPHADVDENWTWCRHQRALISIMEGENGHRRIKDIINGIGRSEELNFRSSNPSNVEHRLEENHRSWRDFESIMGI